MLSLAIRDIRTQRGLTQQELADAIGVSKMTISRWERQPPPEDRLPEIARALQCSVRALLERAAGQAVESLRLECSHVRSDAEANAWRNAIALARLSPEITLMLTTLPAFLDPDSGVVALTSHELITRANLPENWVREHWNTVVTGPWVERLGSVEWALKLVFPPKS
ncbi:hypothetical protein DL240_09240 [Lujinxingia litoralis]|uniref:HTH cro/C1-type domain-containing protein n=2 Tax=Lujinxingia litoralis TaxID=2211119 RepID=A0A328C8R0_9DELT|nr:helix-turn-helix transcriptional regulator [Lujinxingia litoralis]RAL23060.1 hypothetical protein DL240_09240 [Lujinxingia litoralis]